MTIQSATTAQTGLAHAGGVRTRSTGAHITALPETEATSVADAHHSIDEADQLKLSRNVLLGNFTGMTTVQVQAIKLVDPTCGPGAPGSQARIPQNAWHDGVPAKPTPAAASPRRGLLGRMRDAIGAALNRMARPAPLRVDLEKNPALRFAAIQSSPQLRAGFAKACEERFCKEELVAFDAAEAFLAQPDRQTFAAMAFVARQVNLPNDLLNRIERQCPAEGQAPPFDPRAATRLAGDIQTNLKSLLSDNIVQDPKLRGMHGLDDAALLAQLRKMQLGTA